MKHFCRYFLMAAVPLVCLPFAYAQSAVDIGIGFGAAQDSAATQGIDPNTLLGCAPGSNPTGSGCSPTPKLNSFFMGVGGDLMLWNKFGVGAEVNFQPAKSNYLLLSPALPQFGQGAITLQSRLTLYDFNGIYQPYKNKRVALKVEGGIGGANLRFYESGTSITGLTGAQYFSQYFASSNHFQVHAGVGAQIYITEHVFIRPQFDLHWVNNFYQYGRGSVLEETVWLGYTFGGGQ